MVNWWLILLIILIPIIAVGCVVYIIFYFQSEEDRKANLLAKGVFGFGMTLALGSVLLLPFDVANSPDPVSSAKYYKTLNTEIMWEIVLWTMVIMGLAVCPFFLSFYEAYDPDRPRTQKQVTHGTIVALIVTTVFGVITLICYFKAGEAIVPFQSYGATAQLVAVDGGAVTFVSSFSNEKLTLDVTFTTYCIGMACFAGWILFFIYGGVGMVAFPIRTIRDFKMRTKAISATTFNQEMNVVLAKAETLLELSLSLQKESRGRMSRATKNKINIIRNEVYYLEAVQDNLIWAFTEAGGSPFLVYGKLALGIVGAVITILWCLQIFIYNTFGDDPFLNTMLIGLNNVFGLFGVVAYGILTFYLMWATFQGQIALGLRLVFFQIHPMKYRDTPINSLLFNVTLQLMIAFAVICFASLSFQDYAANASITGLMNIYVLRLKGIGTIIRWMQFLFLGVSLLSIIWLALCPKKKHKRDLTKLRLDDLDH